MKNRASRQSQSPAAPGFRTWEPCRRPHLRSHGVRAIHIGRHLVNAICGPAPVCSQSFVRRVNKPGKETRLDVLHGV